MSDTVIKVENLGKQYVLSHQQQGRGKYKTFRESLTQGARALAAPFSKRGQGVDPTREEFWALKDVSFEIKQGDRVGIIGRNGAGKSTLLKILSRITEPTTGRISINGRVASLLEVGTGFHPELTGRENIFLNGAILGMSRAEIRRKFDEIVAFAEVEKFLDTPVKRYSSGMYVRLAFAVAAHLEPEILIVDEVLAVGDAQFQKKCLGKMEEVGKEGRTVIFVSHNMGAIRNLCTVGILLKQGRLITNQTSISNAIEAYLRGDENANLLTYNSTKKNTEKPFIKSIRCFQKDLNCVNNAFNICEPIFMDFEIDRLNIKNLVIGIVIFNSQGICVHHSSDEFRNNKSNEDDKRRCIIPPYGLAPGKYHVNVSLAQRNIELYENKEGVLCFDTDLFGEMANLTKSGDWKGICGPGLLKWL